MKLSIEINPESTRTIAITDYTLELNEYVPESIEAVLPRYDSFKYSDTCTINILKYTGITKLEIVKVLYSTHDAISESVLMKLPLDGHYQVFHLVLPTLQWLEKVINENLSYYLAIYVTDGLLIYKYVNNSIEPIEDILEIIEVNDLYTTISRVVFNIFNIDGLKHCYVAASRLIFDKYIQNCNSCDKYSQEDKFNRDFLWMTINVITYYLEWNKYHEALRILENLQCCNTLCPDINDTTKHKSSCGCNV